MAVSVVNTAQEAIKTTRKAISWLLWAREESNLRDRDIRMLVLRDKENLTSRDILEADFGTVNPNGLSIEHCPAYECRLVDLRESDRYKSALPVDRMKVLSGIGGLAGIGEKIYMNPGYMGQTIPSDHRRSFSNTFSHEHIHRLQGAERDVFWASSFSDLNTSFLHAPHREEGLVGLGKTLISNFSKFAADKRGQRFTKSEDNVTNYFSKEAEVQARLHEVMVQGYAGWQKMPTTKQELWAAMHNMGLRTPSSVLKGLKESAEGQQALLDFRSSPALRYSARRSVRDINRLHQYASFDSNREILWRSALPAMYGNLLELYGDGPGRARMDLGPNPKAALDVLRAVKDNPEIDKEAIKAMVENVDPAHANHLADACIRMAMGFKDSTVDIPPNKRAYDIVDALLAREETKEALLSYDEVKPFSGGFGLPAWWCAMLHDDHEILKRYIDAGLELNKDITVYGFDGERVDNMNLSTLASSLGGFRKKDIEGKSFVDSVKSIFNLSSDMQWEQRRISVDKATSALRFIAEYSGDPDRKREYIAKGEPQEKSMRDLLEIARAPLHSMPVQPADTVHVSETAHM